MADTRNDDTALARLWSQSRVFSLVGLGVALVYSATLAPSLTWSHWGSDGGDFITAAATGRVPHPPGFPTYAMLSRAIVSACSGDPARVLNATSAACAVGAALSVYATARRRELSDWAALAAALILAFSSWMWSQALITEVYTMAALFVCLALYAVERAATRRFLPWAWVGLCLGLGTSTHMTVAFLSPMMILGRQVHWRGFAMGVAAGLVPYALLAASGPWPQPWGDMRSLAGWAEYVSAHIYWGNAFGLAATNYPARTLAWASLMARQFTPVGALAAIAGVARMWSVNRLRVLGGVAALALASLYAIAYNSPDSWVYLVAFLPPMALSAGEGIEWFVDKTQYRVALPVLALIVPVLLVASNWRAMSLAGDREAVNWIGTALGNLPVEAVVVTEEDRHTFALWYATEAMSWRPDVDVVDQRLFGYPPYDGYLEAALGGDARSLEALARTRPLCRIDSEDEVVCP